MKKKLIATGVIAAIAVVAIVGGVLCKKTIDKKNFEKHVENMCSEYNISEDEIYEIGEETIITKDEVEIAKKMYLILQEVSDKEAEKIVVKELEKEKAMYYEATKNGYSVTDEEVDKTLEELRTSLESADNSDAKEILETSSNEVFDSEDEYWEYQRTKTKMQLPITKYMRDLEWDYSAQKAEEGNEKNASWDDEAVKIYEEAVKKQEYKVLDMIF